MTQSPDTQVRFYKALLRIRRTEEILAEEYRKGTMRTPTHFGIGQEAVAVGVCEALERGDGAYSHHRCHTHYLAKGGSPLGLIAELLGREDGCSRGRGGSVHLTDRSVGFIGSSPILGQAMALATGTALAYQMDGSRNVAVAFFGEGACDEGSTYECLNYAAVRKLPVLFVCENNLYATESPLSVRMPEGTDLCERVRSFKVPTNHIDGNDVFGVFASAKKAVDHCRSGGGPFFLECETYRWREHVGPLWDYEANRTYRSKNELEAWMEKCPVKRCGKELLASGAATQKDLDSWLLEIDREIHGVLQKAKDSPWPQPSTLFENIY
jgi:TPP-dependent pyruvate/acetoin dehydrogenase alpha subunit